MIKKRILLLFVLALILNACSSSKSFLDKFVAVNHDFTGKVLIVGAGESGLYTAVYPTT